jgi:hypothetical protein
MDLVELAKKLIATASNGFGTIGFAHKSDPGLKPHEYIRVPGLANYNVGRVAVADVHVTNFGTADEFWTPERAGAFLAALRANARAVAELVEIEGLRPFVLAIRALLAITRLAGAEVCAPTTEDDAKGFESLVEAAQAFDPQTLLTPVILAKLMWYGSNHHTQGPTLPGQYARRFVELAGLEYSHGGMIGDEKRYRQSVTRAFYLATHGADSSIILNIYSGIRHITSTRRVLSEARVYVPGTGVDDYLRVRSDPIPATTHRHGLAYEAYKSMSRDGLALFYPNQSLLKRLPAEMKEIRDDGMRRHPAGSVSSDAKVVTDKAEVTDELPNILYYLEARRIKASLRASPIFRDVSSGEADPAWRAAVDAFVSATGAAAPPDQVEAVLTAIRGGRTPAAAEVDYGDEASINSAVDAFRNLYA